MDKENDTDMMSEKDIINQSTQYYINIVMSHLTNLYIYTNEQCIE